MVLSWLMGWLIGLIVGSGASESHAIQVTTLPIAAEVDRYNQDPAFLSAVPASSEFDFTGVGQAGVAVGENGLSKWATMIGPTTFLSATHSHPAVGNPRFH